ncbi:Endonuclease/exonuclease/phosphatase [Leucosporidium creatinivorum]|uniref:Endonuclease/exonuclease/phosphatase n=1 Tax=Leucosporidium creatinivorum TaxID=106004 RepID=A0A1Y2ECH2_9BASI|nr:Endonuclease/exonuclease/phosphatase [Leucosporidium creatinivorum]
MTTTPSSSTLDAPTTLLSELPSRVSTPDTTLSSEAALKKKVQKEAKAAEAAAKKEQRKKEREAKATAGGGAQEQKKQEQPLRFEPREWAEVPELEKLEVQGKEVSIMTWNMLAQALVRRELFPNSDFLKVKERIPTLMREVLHYAPDVVCLQEVDRLEDHLPVLGQTHGHTSYIGYPNKAHGLLIAHKKDVFEKVGERGLRLDELPIDDSAVPSSSSSVSSTTADDLDASLTHAEDYDGSTPASKEARRAAGLSRSTRNVAVFVALKFKDREGGIIIGTTHLFWHPQHVYERVRQTGILMREARKFRDESKDGEWRSWPTFIAGDFNSQPREITYSLLLNRPLTPQQESELAHSTVVHQSTEEQKAAVAHSVRSGKVQDPDKVIKNCRDGEAGDGLFGVEGLRKLFGGGEGQSVRSAYGEVGGLIKAEEGKWYVDRPGEVQSGNGWVVKEDPEVAERRKKGSWEERVRRGDFEPMWTNCSYIFLLPPSPSLHSSTPAPRFTSLLKTHSTETLGRGLPRMGIEPSDHVSIACKVEVF